MTVADLIELLSDFPQDYEVVAKKTFARNLESVINVDLAEEAAGAVTLELYDSSNLPTEKEAMSYTFNYFMSIDDLDGIIHVSSELKKARVVLGDEKLERIFDMIRDLRK